MILQFAHYLPALEAEKGRKNIQVFVCSSCSLNGRPGAELIDPAVDLAKVAYPFYPKADWILPLEVTLK